MENKELAVKTISKDEHERLRVSLAKLWKKHKDTLKDIGIEDDTLMLSLRSERTVEGTSTFSLAKGKKGTLGDHEFEIVRH